MDKSFKFDWDGDFGGGAVPAAKGRKPGPRAAWDFSGAPSLLHAAHAEGIEGRASPGRTPQAGRRSPR